MNINEDKFSDIKTEEVSKIDRMMFTIFLLASLTTTALTFEDNDLHGISHVGMTVKDLELSTRFYQDVFGAMLIEDLSTGDEGVYGDSHYYRIFQKEILENQNVPDIRTSGTHEVNICHIFMPIYI